MSHENTSPIIPQHILQACSNAHMPKSLKLSKATNGQQCANKIAWPTVLGSLYWTLPYFATMTSQKKTDVQGLCKHVTHEHAMTTQLHFLRVSTPFVAQQDLHINKTNQTALTGEPHWACWRPLWSSSIFPIVSDLNPMEIHHDSLVANRKNMLL